MWRERFAPEAPELPVLVCDGCGETAMIRNGQWITLIPGRKETP
jgi:hypothetical protein